MDQDIRNLERRAKNGDLRAAIQWLAAVTRTADIAAQYEAMMLIGELQYSGLLEMADELDRVSKLVQMPPVEDGYASTEIELIDGGASATTSFSCSRT
jgi:hypothetical protein